MYGIFTLMGGNFSSYSLAALAQKITGVKEHMQTKSRVCTHTEGRNRTKQGNRIDCYDQV